MSSRTTPQGIIASHKNTEVESRKAERAVANVHQAVKRAPEVRRDVQAPPRNVGIRFLDRDAFGRFCLSLQEDKVPFSVGGKLSVFLFSMMPRSLPRKSRRVYERYLRDGLASVYDASKTGRRRIPTPEEAKTTLNELTTELRARRMARE